MTRVILQADIHKRGLVLDPRTKLLLLITMSVFVLGYAGGEELSFLMPFFCCLPAVALITAGKWKQALIYAVVYSVSYISFSSWVHLTTGFLHFLLFGVFGILSRILPCLMMGSYMVSTTTVSEFTAAMLRMHMPEVVIIPLSVMFRFFPTVIDEWSCINAAMKMRDIRFGGKNISKMLEFRIVPLMACCAKIGEELSAAALTRGLGGKCKRTNICKIGFHVQDFIVLILCIVPYIFLGMKAGGLL